MNKILVTRQIPQHYVEQLKKIGQVVKIRPGTACAVAVGMPF